MPLVNAVTVIGLVVPVFVLVVPPSVLAHDTVNPVIGLPPFEPGVNATDTAPEEGVEFVTVGAAGTVADTNTVAPKALNGPGPTALFALTRQW